MPERATWASKAGFVLASAGAAVGLGAIWKFPWLAGSNGGAVFVIPYVILSLTLALCSSRLKLRSVTWGAVPL